MTYEKIAAFFLVISMLVFCGLCQRDISSYPFGECQYEQRFNKGSFGYYGRLEENQTNEVRFEESIFRGYDNFSWTTSYNCTNQGVLSVRVPISAQAVIFSINTFKPTDYTFHISTNERSEGGGQGAEIYNVGETLHVYKRNIMGGRPPHTSIPHFLNYPQVFHNIRINRNNSISFTSKGRSRSYQLEMEDEPLFDLNDPIYIGVNRAIGNPSLYGMGVCGICVYFENRRAANSVN